MFIFSRFFFRVFPFKVSRAVSPSGISLCHPGKIYTMVLPLIPVVEAVWLWVLWWALPRAINFPMATGRAAGFGSQDRTLAGPACIPWVK